MLRELGCPLPNEFLVKGEHDAWYAPHTRSEDVKARVRENGDRWPVEAANANGCGNASAKDQIRSAVLYVGVDPSETLHVGHAEFEILNENASHHSLVNVNVNVSDHVNGNGGLTTEVM